MVRVDDDLLVSALALVAVGVEAEAREALDAQRPSKRHKHGAVAQLARRLRQQQRACGLLITGTDVLVAQHLEASAVVKQRAAQSVDVVAVGVRCSVSPSNAVERKLAWRRRDALRASLRLLIIFLATVSCFLREPPKLMSLRGAVVSEPLDQRKVTEKTTLFSRLLAWIGRDFGGI